MIWNIDIYGGVCLGIYDQYSEYMIEQYGIRKIVDDWYFNIIYGYETYSNMQLENDTVILNKWTEKIYANIETIGELI